MRVLLALPGDGSRGDPAVHQALREAVEETSHELMEVRLKGAGDAARNRMAFEHNYHLLQDADAIVADVGEPSTSVGWMVAWALTRARLVVVCVPRARQGALPPLVGGNPSPWQRIVTYDDVPHLKAEITGILTR